ncbi:twin transmembrane helix small protein [Comamonas composti]|uniref:twin transmembrane helix small protein n=1 Tax=Comamonas composti TaxID=408558 RepID=UPI00047CFA17|nr:twin transmembrane helix small protein [Comamonas composti]
MKFVIALAFLAIVASLGSALFFMMRRGDASGHDDQDDGRRSRSMFRALALRVALSIALFICVLLAAKLGYIHPTGWGPHQ